MINTSLRIHQRIRSLEVNVAFSNHGQVPEHTFYSFAWIVMGREETIIFE